MALSAPSTHTGVAADATNADAAICAACVAEIFDPFSRRFRYPLTHCKHCGPRLELNTGVPHEQPPPPMPPTPMCPSVSRSFAPPRPGAASTPDGTKYGNPPTAATPAPAPFNNDRRRIFFSILMHWPSYST